MTRHIRQFDVHASERIHHERDALRRQLWEKKAEERDGQ
jgi:hypothetical protein